MNSTRLFKKTVIAATIALASQQALAAGFQLNAQSATGLGRAFAGDAVIADNASVMARNPAAMALFKETSMSLGVTSITSQIEVKDAEYKYFNGLGHSTAESNYSNAGSTALAPNIHLIVPINDKFAWGVNAYSNFGTKTEFDETFVGAEYGGLTDVKSANLGLAGSYRINEQFSIGAGLDIIYGQGKMERKVSTKIPALIGGGSTALTAEADGWALGFNLGTVYEMDENNRFGLSYRYSPTINAKGDIKKGSTEFDTLVMPLPDMAEFSGYHRITDTKFAVHYSVQWIGWSAFDKLDAKGAQDETLKEYNWQNGMHYAIGGTYYLNQDWTLRAGYMYDTSAQQNDPKKSSVSVPDSNRQWFSGGFTYHLTAKSNIDFGFTYLLGQDVEVYEETKMGPLLVSSIDATTRANAILVGLQYSRSF